jgi:DNA-binding HxlR family transcriptional regulator
MKEIVQNPRDTEMGAALKRSACPITNTLDLIGDKWTLLIVRDILLHSKHRYGEFLASDEGIPTNILADRLKRLEAHDLLTKTAYQQRPVRHEYHLTDKGQALEPLIRELVRWGLAHIPGTGRSQP